MPPEIDVAFLSLTRGQTMMLLDVEVVYLLCTEFVVAALTLMLNRCSGNDWCMYR